MAQTLEDFVWVFVGCGGTFYAASPYLAILRKRYEGKVPILIDPDHIGRGNQNRQWPGSSPGILKVSCADDSLGFEYGDVRPIEIAASFSSVDPILEDQTDGLPVLAIVNVDNDEARIAVADWLASRTSTGIMVVSGCERAFGQCYPGVWMNGEAVHDWRDHHPDVGTESGSMHRCNLQDIKANALTGVCVGMCVEDVARQVETGMWASVLEFYWQAPDISSLKMWSTVVQCGGRINHG